MPAKKTKRNKVSVGAKKRVVGARRNAARKSPVRARKSTTASVKARKKVSPTGRTAKIRTARSTSVRVTSSTRKTTRKAAGPAAAKAGPTVARRRTAAPHTPRRVDIETILAGMTKIEPSVPVAAKPSALPEAYGTQKLHLVARDPRWLYANWDFTRDQQRHFNQLSSSGHLSLRVYRDSPGGGLVQQAELAADTRHWFFPVGLGETNYVADLGYKNRRGEWVSVALSNVAVTPPDAIVPEKVASGPVVFATIPMHATFAQIRQVLGVAGTGNVAVVESIRRYAEASKTAAGREVSVTAPEAPWTLEKARRLARVMGAESIFRSLRGDLASLAAAQIVPAESAEWPDFAADWNYEQFDSPGFSGPGWSGDLVCTEA